MINLNTRITLPLKPVLKFFATHNLSDWGFNAYFKYNDKPQKESKQRETYLVCLNDILLYNKDDDIERYVKELIKRVKAKLNKEHVPTFSQSVNYGSDCSFSGNVFHFNPHMKRNQEVEAGIQQEVGKRQKRLIQYLGGRNVHDDPIDNPIRWYIDGNDISRVLWEYRDKCVTTGEKGNRFSSDIDELVLNGIYFISFKNKRYQIEMSLYQKMVLELKSKFSIQYDDDFDFVISQLGEGSRQSLKIPSERKAFHSKRGLSKL
ncbi:hypothetical protein EDC94DRAFT_688881 [Helicostylum pulchrum]|nr:hypothetical protein EDC94DRAFT_688881 [Helicostylum pulchrum]